MDLKDVIRVIPNFPKEGISFLDITPVLHDPEAFRASVSQMETLLEGVEFDLLAGPESRGFIFSTPLAYSMRKGFVPVRKEGKLPHQTVKKAYALEYGSAVIEIHKDAILPGQKIVIVDDLLATGGTCKALCELIEEMGGEVVAAIFLIELDFLRGRDVLKGYNVHSVVRY
ncbi:MAG: adenine phosphoribosyltransferase [Clostridiales bacterium]|jgi:adenine phosphoribosyltransferase|nr:adenine phosphoribosyltransferase [Clostridiales bacterium]